MRKFIWILSLLITIHILSGKVKAGTGIYLPRTFETITNESVKSTLDKYFSDFEFGNKKYRILLTDDNTTYDYIHEKLLRYGNIGVLFMPKSKKIVCQKQKYGITSAFFDKNGQVETISRNNTICSKRSVEKVLTLPGKVDMTEIETFNIDFNGKVYIDKKNAEKIFK